MTFSYIGLGLTFLVPAYLCILIILRDIMIVGGATYAIKHKLNMDLRPSLLSKINTGFQILLIGYTVLIQFLSSVAIDLSILDLIQVLIIITTLFTTIGSGIGYGQTFFNTLKARA